MRADNIRPYKLPTVGADIIRPFFYNSLLLSCSSISKSSSTENDCITIVDSGNLIIEEDDHLAFWGKEPSAKKYISVNLWVRTSL
ncbi:MAG: hypothetical protein FWG64_05150 [Firmicutes bacterium]|nr:hypothetical protein [Bacillota bacterium]